MEPKPEDYGYALDEALSAIVALRAEIPEDAFTAKTLGTERSGNGVLIPGPLVLTIGYLVTEAEAVWLTLSDGRVVGGHVLGYDQETGFGLVQPLARVAIPPLAIGSSAAARVGHGCVLAAAGGRAQSTATRLVARHAFAGYWEYALSDAMFTAPANANWGGAGLIGPDGALIGIGSLMLQAKRSDGTSDGVNMIVPIDLVKPILSDLATIGRPNKAARPWLGVLASEMNSRIVIIGLAEGGPAAKAGLRAGDFIVEVASTEVTALAGFYAAYWALGNAGVAVPVVVSRDGRDIAVTVQSADRRRYLKGPVLH